MVFIYPIVRKYNIHIENAGFFILKYQCLCSFLPPIFMGPKASCASSKILYYALGQDGCRAASSEEATSLSKKNRSRAICLLIVTSGQTYVLKE